MSAEQSGVVVYLGSAESPILTFDSDQIWMFNYSNSIDVIGNELSLDTLEVGVFYSDDRDTLKSLNYATQIVCYNGGVNDGQLIGKYYFESVERQGVSKWLIRATSVVGIAEKESFYGGFYTAEPFENVVNEILFTDGLKKDSAYTAYTPINGRQYGVTAGVEIIPANKATYNAWKYRWKLKFKIIDKNYNYSGSGSYPYNLNVDIGDNTHDYYLKVRPCKETTEGPEYWTVALYYGLLSAGGQTRIIVGSQYDDYYQMIGVGSVVDAEVNPLAGYMSIKVDYVLPGETEISGRISETMNVNLPYSSTTLYPRLGEVFYSGQLKLQFLEQKLWDETSRPLIDAIYAKNEKTNNYVVLNAADSSGQEYSSSSYRIPYGESIGSFRNANHILRDMKLSKSLQFSDSVENLKVYGWLNTGTKRDALHKLLFANNVSLLRTQDGNLLFTVLTYSTRETIDELQLYDDSSEQIITGAKQISVIEHSYESSTGSSVVVFNNSSNSLISGEYIAFFQNAPIEGQVTGNGITILYSNCNAAIVTGRGTISGKPYIHSQSTQPFINTSVIDGNEVSIGDVGLITGINADNVMAKLKNYYSGEVKRISNSIIVNAERCGQYYLFRNLFKSENSGFLTKMSSVSSSIIKAMCEFISGFVPVEAGGYNSYDLFLSGETWTIPSSVRSKGVPTIRLTIIGKGGDGTNGTNGEDGALAETGSGRVSRQAGTGGKGGKGGKAGAGGKIYAVTVNVANVNHLTVSSNGDNVIVTTYNDSGSVISTYTSASGTVSEIGFVHAMTGDVYALPGVDGYDGGDGGTGGAANVTSDGASTGKSSRGGDVLEWTGGAGLNGLLFQKSYGRIGNYYRYTRGVSNYSGGGGAAYGSNGNVDSFDSSLTTYDYYKSVGANGANASTPAARTQYGCGGYGGHGGGGGGGAGNVFFSERWDGSQTIYDITISNTAGKGGTGSAGTPGIQGCAIVYY